NRNPHRHRSVSAVAFSGSVLLPAPPPMRARGEDQATARLLRHYGGPLWLYGGGLREEMITGIMVRGQTTPVHRKGPWAVRRAGPSSGAASATSYGARHPQ